MTKPIRWTVFKSWFVSYSFHQSVREGYFISRRVSDSTQLTGACIMSSLVTLLKAGQMRIGNILQINLKNCFWHGYNLTSLEFFVNTYLQIADSLHQDHMKGMHQKPMFFPVLWPPCFHQQWMPLKGYSPPWNNPDWPQTLLALSCWHWVEPKIHQLATSVVWSAILRSYFLRVMVYLLHPVYKHARGMMFFQIIHNSLWLHIGL